MQTEKVSNAWIFQKKGLSLAFALEDNTVIFSMIPREDVNEARYHIEEAGYQVTTSDGVLQVIQEDSTNLEQPLANNAEFLIRVGNALMDTFLGGDWDSDIAFTYPSHLPKFAKSVLEETRKIPKGKVATYGEIAERIGAPGGARAVGNALGRNPLPLIVPCHRVVKSDLRVGGFMQTADGSVRSNLKREMLEREGVHFIKGRVDQGKQLTLA